MSVLLDRRGAGAPDEAFYTFIYSPLRDTMDSDVNAVIVLALDVTEEVRSQAADGRFDAAPP